MTAKEYNNCTRLWADDVMRFAVRVCPDRTECEDAVQEAFAALWQNHDNVRESNGKSYLMGVAYRQLMRGYRRRKADRRMVSYQQETRQEPDTAFEAREAIDKALQTLPDVQRAILQLRDVEGYSYHEIGDTLELSDDQVQVYLFRARVAMRKELIKMGYDEYKQQ